MHFHHLFIASALFVSYTPHASGCNSMVEYVSPLPREVMANHSCAFRATYPGFACSSGQCIKASWLCDGGAPDCDDGSDESQDICGPRFCVYQLYHGGFNCSDGECIKASWKCDGGIPDCQDGSDESKDVCGGECFDFKIMLICSNSIFWT